MRVVLFGFNMMGFGVFGEYVILIKVLYKFEFFKILFGFENVLLVGMGLVRWLKDIFIFCKDFIFLKFWGMVFVKLLDDKFRNVRLVRLVRDFGIGLFSLFLVKFL